MSAEAAADIGTAILRVCLGIVFVAHGWNHIFGGGKIAGTARWFDSLGVRPGMVHAWLASLTELASGALLILGWLMPLACAGVVGTMVVAWITNHRRNGFFIFRPGEGYEYVMTLTAIGFGLSGIGAGRWSLDNLLGWFDPPGWLGVAIVFVGGVGGALALLLVFWRPHRCEPSGATS